MTNSLVILIIENRFTVRDGGYLKIVLANGKGYDIVRAAQMKGI